MHSRMRIYGIHEDIRQALRLVAPNRTLTLGDKGDVSSAKVHADKLIQLSPGDGQAIALRSSLNRPQ